MTTIMQFIFQDAPTMISNISTIFFTNIVQMPWYVCFIFFILNFATAATIIEEKTTETKNAQTIFSSPFDRIRDLHYTHYQDFGLMQTYPISFQFRISKLYITPLVKKVRQAVNMGLIVCTCCSTGFLGLLTIMRIFG